MLSKLLRMLKYKQRYFNNETFDQNKKGFQAIPESLFDIKERLNQIFSECDDFTIREVVLGNNKEIKILIAFIDGIVRKEIIDNDILKPILTESKLFNLSQEMKKYSAVDFLKERLISLSCLTDTTDFNNIIDSILSGKTAIFVDGSCVALKADTTAFESRGVEEPSTEAVVRGPREGFNETLKVNIALMRRKIKNENLKIEIIELGNQTKTEICICYIKGIANESVVEMVKNRLSKINIDVILESGYIEEFIEDAPFSIFPTVGNTEKPDVTAAKILDGRVAILCDGTPFVLTVPYLFVESIQVSEDYYSRPFFTSFIRILRIVALIITAVVPALYVALVSFHLDIIPTKLMLAIAGSRVGIPYSAFMEALIMSIVYELLREAGVRMPRPIGQAVSIVGALVLGEAAVAAGIISNIMVIIVAITAISSFIVPPMAGTMPFLKFALLIAANIIGLMGIALVGAVFLMHMCALKSFGIPYLAPFTPLTGTDLKDTFIRVPIWSMLTRPNVIKRGNLRKKTDK